MKSYKVTLAIEANNKDEIERMLDGMPHADRIWDEKIEDPDENILEARIRYCENWNGKGEHYVVETKWTHEEEWGLDTAFPLRDDNIHYTALTKVRELMNMGIPFYFA